MLSSLFRRRSQLFSPRSTPINLGSPHGASCLIPLSYHIPPLCTRLFSQRFSCKIDVKYLYNSLRVSDCRQRHDLSDIVTKVHDIVSKCVCFCDKLSQCALPLSPRRTYPSARSGCTIIARNFRIRECSIRLQHTGCLEGQSNHVSWKKRKSQTEAQLAKKRECPEPDADVRGCSPGHSI